MKLTEKNKKFLLKLSRKSLQYLFKTGRQYQPDTEEIPDALKKVAATFVTLTKNKKLRGCIGKLTAQKKIFEDVIENTYSAALNDPRFPQLKKEELEKIKIEISVLSKAKKLNYKKSEDIIMILKKDKPGVVLEYGMYRATYLPQVWEQLKKPEEFIGSLCQKAGLPKNFWKEEKLKFKTYTVIKFSE